MVVSELEKKLFEVSYDLVLKMNEKRERQLDLSAFLLEHNVPWEEHILAGERVIINTTESPDGALGAFLLLKKHRFKDCLGIYKNFFENLIKKDLSTYVPPNQNERIQDYFERRFKEVIEGVENVFGILRSCQDHMNEYDFMVFTDYDVFLIEVKSDAYLNTGNVSLELVRDVRKPKEETNIGSIIKTKADFWYVYYYSKKFRSTFKSEFLSVSVYPVRILKEATYKIMNLIHQTMTR